MSEQRRASRDKKAAERRARSVAAGAGLSVGALLGLTPAAQAADFTVSDLGDAGPGTLRDAIADANLTPAADRILFQSSVTGQITLTTGQIPIDYPLEIVGPGATVLTVAGGGTERIFAAGDYSQPGMDVTISGLTLTGGYADSPDGGGAVLSRGADLTIAGSVLTGNYSTDAGGPIAQGGAVTAAEGSLTVVGSNVDDNRVENDQAGGAGIYAVDTDAVTITNSSISGNSTFGFFGIGGAILATDAGDITIERSTLDGNDAGGIAYGAAGAIASNGADQVTIQRSTISDNDSATFAGAIYSIGEPLSVLNSTISGNETGSEGGAISSSNGAVELLNATISGNEGRFPNSVGGGVYLCACSSVTIRNTILADNVADDGADLYLSGGAPPLTSFSLIEAPVGGGTIDETVPGSNRIGVDPQLEELAANGGPTETQALAQGSPAIDAGDDFGAGTDQRGVARPFDFPGVPSSTAAGANGSDIGAFELNQVLTPVEERTCADRKATIVATGGKLKGTKGPDVIFGSKGRDVIRGGGGNDLVCGRGGNDLLRGGAGNDRLFGGIHNDTLIGGPGKDGLRPGKGKDTLIP